VPFEVLNSQVEEHEPPGVDPRLVAKHLALEKGRAVAAIRPEAMVVAADTVVAVDRVSLGKPADQAGAMRMLEFLSGREHEVITSVAVLNNGDTRNGVVISRVTMRDADKQELAEYVPSAEPYDKAGGYALQGRGGALVESVRGCTLAVVGFPLCLVHALLHDRETPNEDDIKICEEAADAAYPGSVRGSHRAT
jgi:septum formation protein